MALDNELAVDIIQCLGRYWSDNEHSDCRISVDGQVFHASRFHLSACSEFFRQVFHTESITHKENIVIKGISADVFSCVTKALFTGVTGLDESNMVDVWLAASYLKIDFLVKKCEMFIGEHLTKENFLQLFKRISCIGSVAVTNKIIRLIALEFDEFRKTDTFLNLPSEMVIKIVESGEVKSQDNLVESVLKWASHVTKDVVGTFRHQLYEDFQGALENVCDDSCTNFGFRIENVCQFVVDNVRREEHLGQIIIKVKLSELSEAGLKMIYENSQVMRHQDAKDAIMRELADRTLYRSDKTVAVCSDNQVTTPAQKSPDSRWCVVEDLDSYDIVEIPDWVVALHKIIPNSISHSKFDTLSIENRIKSSVILYLINRTFVVYNMYWNKTYVLHIAEGNVKRFYVHEGIIYYSLKKVEPYACKTTVHKIVNANTSVVVYMGRMDVSTSSKLKYFTTYHYIYRFQLSLECLTISKNLIRKRSKRSWQTVSTSSLSQKPCKFSFHSSLTIGEKILFFVTGEAMHIFYFDAKSEQVNELYTVKSEFSNFKIFTKSSEYYMLLGNGQLFQIKTDDTFSIVFCEQLWSGTLTLHGVFHDGYRLFVCTDSHAKITKCPSQLAESLKFYTTPSLIWNRQCEDLQVDSDWLINKI